MKFRTFGFIALMLLVFLSLDTLASLRVLGQDTVLAPPAPVNAVANLTSLCDAPGVVLRWDPVESIPGEYIVTSYTVYRSYLPLTDGADIGHVSLAGPDGKLIFLDSNALSYSGQTLYYTVRAQAYTAGGTLSSVLSAELAVVIP